MAWWIKLYRRFSIVQWINGYFGCFFSSSMTNHLALQIFFPPLSQLQGGFQWIHSEDVDEISRWLNQKRCKGSWKFFQGVNEGVRREGWFGFERTLLWHQRCHFSDTPSICITFVFDRSCIESHPIGVGALCHGRCYVQSYQQCWFFFFFKCLRSASKTHSIKWVECMQWGNLA